MLSSRLDKIAILLSGVCIVHCLIAPILITLIPILSINTYVDDALFHILMLVLVLPTSIVALFIGCRKHRSPLIIFSGMTGILILILVAIFGHDIFTSQQEPFITSLGGVFLAISHILNYRTCQKLICNDKNCTNKHHH